MTHTSSEPAEIDLLPFDFAKEKGVLLQYDDAGNAQLLYRAGVNPAALSEVQRFAGRPLPIKQIDADTFDITLTQLYQSGAIDASDVAQDIDDDLTLDSLVNMVPENQDLLSQDNDAPVIRLINALLTNAIKDEASDIHVETYEKNLQVRFRIDGVLDTVLEVKKALAPLLVSRIKVMAKLDIAEKRLPQDGRISLTLGGRNIDLRVSTIPTNNGERVVMRLLDTHANTLNLADLGMKEHDLLHFRRMIQKPHGIIMVTGPTGSGKTTSLYAALSELNNGKRNIMTIEDPVEYNIKGIGQTQVNMKIDMTFARGLRAILRQDPDIVLIGEIRDRETAEIAVQASLTGHLVLSTLHTNTALGAITRLQDMGVEPFLLTSSLVGMIGQRLVRVLCADCKTAYRASPTENNALNLPDDSDTTLYRATGCKSCNQSGYKGRMGIYELVSIDDTLRELIHKNASELDLQNTARKQGNSISEDGYAKVINGHTTIEEVLRVANSS